MKLSPFSSRCFLCSSTASDLDCIRALFNEKEKELSLAVAKVDELTRQLEELRGRQNAAGTGAGSGGPGGVGGGGGGGPGSGHLSTPASAELEKLRRELMVSLSLLFSAPSPCRGSSRMFHSEIASAPPILRFICSKFSASQLPLNSSIWGI